MNKSNLPRASKENLKKYKQIFTEYYIKINSEKDPETLKNESLTFIKSYNKVVKNTKGVGQTKTKINWDKLESSKDDSYIQQIGNIDYRVAAKLSNFHMTRKKMVPLDNFLKTDKELNNIISTNDIQKLKSIITELHKNIENIHFDDGGATMWGFFGLSGPNVETFLKKLSTLKNICDNSDTLPENIKSGVNEFITIAKEFSDKYYANYSKAQKIVDDDLAKNKAVEEEKEKRGQSSTLVAIKTAKNNPTKKNIMNVINLSAKHHPLVLGLTAIKINNCLKKKKF